VPELKQRRTRGTTKRLEDTGYYCHPWVQKLPKDGIHLYKYLFSNSHCNQAGLYKISLQTISFETKIDIDELPQLLKLMEKNVKWWPDIDLMWVKEFFYEQCNSPTFLTAAVNCLSEIKQKDVVDEFMEYNLREHDLELFININDTQPKRGEAPLKEVGKTDDLKLAGMISYYEQCTGRTLTPTDFEKLKDFAANYPEGWFEKAVDQAVKNNARSPMSYIGRILEHWKQDGVTLNETKPAQRTQKYDFS